MSTTNPRYPQICALLDKLVPPSDPNIAGGAPHGRFWWQNPFQNPPPNQPPTYVDRDTFVKMDASQWSVFNDPNNNPIPLVNPGTAATSPLYMALSGAKPFDGSGAPQMPDTGLDPSARHATQEEQTMVATWINNGAPA